jgi:hypothetical protein
MRPRHAPTVSVHEQLSATIAAFTLGAHSRHLPPAEAGGFRQVASPEHFVDRLAADLYVKGSRA